MARKKKSVGTRKSTINKRRKGFAALALPWLKRFGIALGVVVLIIWCGAWFFLSDANEKASAWTKERLIEASAQAGFRVADILVEGRKHADADVILAVINVQKGDPLFAFSPREAKEQLERISWVERAHVERRLPDTLYIRLEERKAVARWKEGEALKLLDSHGQVIATDNITRFKGLMIVSGQGVPEHMPELVESLHKEEEIAARVVAAQLVSQRRWDLVLDNGITVKLPEEDMAHAITRLKEAHEESGLLDKAITAIDLREGDRIAVRVKSGEVQNYKAGAIKTGSQI